MTTCTTWLLVLVAPLAACGSDRSAPAPAPDAHGLAVRVGPLALAGVTDAHYRITVANADGDTVAVVDELASSRYGTGRGDLAYVAPCDAAANPNRLTLELLALDDAPGHALDASTWVNPTPLVVDGLTCVEGGDTPVELDLVVVRDATQGFFDVAVTFEDIFCSAKLDCREEDGSPITLLHDPETHERAQTIILGFACAAGPGEQTVLYMDDVHIRCDDGHAYAVNPAVGPGNLGDDAPLLFERATYWGNEALAGLDKCYWNLALGLDLTPPPGRCVLEGRATATGDDFVDQTSPAHTRWPLVHWSVDLTDATGALACGRERLGDDTVRVDYTALEGERFDHRYACGASPGELQCAGLVALPGAEAVTVKPAGSTFELTLGGRTSGPFNLPGGTTLGRCCVDPCCAAP